MDDRPSLNARLRSWDSTRASKEPRRHLEQGREKVGSRCQRPLEIALERQELGRRWLGEEQKRRKSL